MEDLRITANVQRGARWLDQHRPGWVGEIDLITLDVSNPEYCVLGQLHGHYDRGPAVFTDASIDDADDRAVEHGFLAAVERYTDDLAWIDAEYRELTVAWTDLIEQRIGALVAAGVTGDGA